MATLYDVPERFCPKGHRITGKAEVLEKDKNGNLIVTAIVNTSILICETCAWEAGGGETLEGMRHRPVKGKRLEKLGQESFLGKVPAKFIA